MLRKFLISLPLMIAVTAAGLGLAAHLIHTKPEPVVKIAKARPMRVETYLIELQRVQETLVGYGTARPDQVTTISAQVGGKIVEVAKGLEDGSEIKMGQLLLRIEEEDYKQQYTRATNLIKADQATLKQIELERKNLEKLIESAEQDFRIVQDERLRVSRLYEKSLAAKREFDLIRSALLKATSELDNLKTRLAVLDPRKEQALASIAAHEAEVALAKLSLERCRIVAPFDGQVQQRMVEVGETVRPSQPVLIALKLDRIEVPIELPANCVSKIEIGNACTLAVESMPTVRWSGRLQRLGPAVDPQSRTFTAYVVVDNGKQKRPLLPGLFVRAEVSGPVYTDAMVIPRGAILEGAVFVAVDGQARRKPVTLACTLRDRAVVTSGVRAGDALIVTNLASLEDNMPVEVERPVPKLANSRSHLTPTSQAAGEPQ